jgi:rhamnogalacturonyl hydrolase YesR
LRRPVDSGSELCFGYAPQANTRIYNASLLAAEALASVGNKTSEPKFSNLAIRAANYVVRQQREDGSWLYGADQNQQWVDNFHTAFVLNSLVRIIRYSSDEIESSLKVSVNRGYEYWRQRFFLADGWPKYYDDALYPADAHAAAAAIVTLCDLESFGDDEIRSTALSLAEKIAAWTIHNLRDPKGFFYYQKRRLQTVRTPFMRWSEAWMSYALARLIEEESNKDHHSLTRNPER